VKEIHMNLFRVDASPKRSRSNSRALADHFVDQLRARVSPLTVDALDVAVAPPPHPTELFAQAIYMPPDQRTPAMVREVAYSDGLCRRLLAADAVVCAMPMHNWSVPSTFKAFIDNVTRGGLTFVSGPDGRSVGQLGGKRVLFITARGGDGRPGGPYAHMDALTPVLRAAFSFMGVEHPRFVDAQPLQFAAPEAREAALARARAELDAVAADWAA
jgi:FMN-dependent NADH-azoreductase